MSTQNLIVILGLIATIGRLYGPDVLALINWLQQRKAKPQ